MAWQNLYRWEKGLEPKGVIELRQAKNEQVRSCQLKSLAAKNAAIKKLAQKTICNTHITVTQDAFNELSASCLDVGIKIGNSALKKRLKSFGYDCSNIIAKNSGWPKNWPKHISNFIAHWIQDGHIAKGFDADEFVFVEDIANRCIQSYIKEFGDDDIADCVSSRSMRRALDIKGYDSIKIRDGMIALIGYRLSKH